MKSENIIFLPNVKPAGFIKIRDVTFDFSYSWIIFLFFIFTSLCSCKKAVSTKPQLIDIKMDILTQLNALRAKGCDCGSDTMQPVKPMVWNDDLEKAAADHAMDMYNKNYFAHVSPTGITPDDWAQQEGYNALDLGEDIAENYITAEATIAAWQNSPEHCTVMMDSTYQDVGAARYGDYWVLLLGHR